MSTHNQCFRAIIRKNVYPCKPQFYYTKVGCKGVFVTRTCFRDYHFIAEKNRRILHSDVIVMGIKTSYIMLAL